MSNEEKLLCGCFISETTDSNGDSVFLFEPCSLDCEYYQYAIAEAKRQHKEMTTLDLRDIDP